MSIVAIYLIFSMLAVIWFDVTQFIIPNWLVGSLLIVYPLAVYLSPVHIDWKMALAGMGIVFAIGYVIFALNWMGGGDIKLLTVVALWVGWQHLLEYMIMVSILGGALSVILWSIRKSYPYIGRAKEWPRILREGEPAPYGVAIAIGLLIQLWLGQVSVLAAG